MTEDPLHELVLSVGGLTLPALACGPRDGPVVLCLHGFPDHPGSYRPILAALGARGFFAVAPTARGYVPGALPLDGDYRIESIAADVPGCLDALGVERAHLLGHDWGAVVAHTAAALYPDRLLSLTTVSVPHLARIPQAVFRVPRQLLRGWYQTFFQVPLLSDWAVRRRGWALVRWLCGRWSPAVGPSPWSLTDRAWAERVVRFEAPGVRAGMLAYYRQNLSLPRLIFALRGGLRHLQTIPVRTLAITGARDGCMDTRLYDVGLDPADFPAGLRVERIADAGHFVHLEQPERFVALLLSWLGQQPDR